MSRPGMSSSGRNLTLTEELERLEQSITLTLQEIDHNFSKAHRIVTTSILPLVEQYGEHSKNVWEASKFWKQFFEASANVSLSGYEELAGEGDETVTAEETTVDETRSDYDATQDDTAAEPSEYHDHHQPTHDPVEDSLLEDATITGSTPRPPATKSMQAQFADFDSPYQALRRELKGGAVFKDDLPPEEDEAEYGEAADGTMQLPSYHHGSTTRLPDMSMTPRSSSLLLDEPTVQHSAAQKSKDMLLHRVLDKNYRLQATPLKAVALPRPRGRSPQRKDGQGEPEEDRTRRALWAESPMSSPEMAVPKLRSDLYMSPLRTRRRSKGEPPRTPGVSVQTPATARKRDIFAEVRSQDHGNEKGKGRALDEITWESDEDDLETDSVFGGMSPPKTIQFALPPSKLMQTPAREASRRIVDDILITAGAAPEESLEYSPTMVKMNHDILDDTF
ncbi:DASH complex subunit Ask1-domain-containing protein [Xylaria palmicola]|nr:DASH complex subunit Ask1-domain-containing protein [Xylaria palmicola]